MRLLIVEDEQGMAEGLRGASGAPGLCGGRQRTAARGWIVP